jgi:hypothetical protein
MAVLFEMVNNPAAYDAVDVPEDLRWFQNAVSYHVEVVGHNDIGIDGETSRFPSFIQGFAGYDLNLFGSKDGKAVFGYSCDVKSRSVSRNDMHEA